jgi:hypothetical protein
MKYFKMLLISLLSIFIISFVTNESNFVSADDGYEEKYETHREDHDGEGEVYEDIGSTFGWGTIIAMGAAAIIFPLRKSAKWIIKTYPQSKIIFLSISKFFRKYHLLIGTVALVLSLFHGVAMYLSEGGLEIEGIIGLGAFIFMLIAAIFGTILSKNKKVKSFRTAHTILIAIALLIGFVHIITA